MATEDGCTKTKKAAAATPPPPPPPPLPKFASTASVTNQEIDKFWKQKQMEEENHFLAAIKDAARIRAHKLAKDDHKQFMESLEEEEDMKASDPTHGRPGKTGENNELRVGIKDWWTKSKYAYLNQPAIQEAKDMLKRPTTTYVPHYFHYKPSTPSPTTTFGIF